MMHLDPVSILERWMGRNPSVAGNPQARAYIDILKSGDSARGEEVASNLLQTYGMDRETALAQARRFFGL